jgi:molybdopterin-guanine dinucleotide biosynthesis protein A
MNFISPLYGLVISGGLSTRMGADKSLINYHGKPQRYYLYDMLTTLCGKAVISCNKIQAKEIPERYGVIIDSDKYEQIGPMGGLLSAFEKYHEASFLVVGCDYPFIKAADVQILIDSYKTSDLASTYYNEKEQIREPLLGLYKAGCNELLSKQFGQKDYSLNRFLKNVNSVKILPSSPEIIQSVDNPEQYQDALNTINAQKA